MGRALLQSATVDDDDIGRPFCSERGTGPIGPRYPGFLSLATLIADPGFPREDASTSSPRKDGSACTTSVTAGSRPDSFTAIIGRKISRTWASACARRGAIPIQSRFQ